VSQRGVWMRTRSNREENANKAPNIKAAGTQRKSDGWTVIISTAR
jgi:hypothetical protein